MKSTVRSILGSALGLVLLAVPACYQPALPSGKFSCSVNGDCPEQTPVCVESAAYKSGECIVKPANQLCWSAVKSRLSACRGGNQSCIDNCAIQLQGDARSAFTSFGSCAATFCQTAGAACAAGATDDAKCLSCLETAGSFANAELKTVDGPCMKQVTACKVN